MIDSPRFGQEIRTVPARKEAQEFQRREQQGLGKPIISAEFQEHRVIAVGGTLHFSKNEPPRILRRLLRLREWSQDEEVPEVFPRSP